MITSEVLTTIDDVNTAVMESEIAVCFALADSYDKMLMITENYDGGDMDGFSIFQEGKIMDDVKKQGEGMSTIMKILSLIPRLIKSVFRALTGKLKNMKGAISDIKENTKKLKKNKDKDKDKRIKLLKAVGIGVAGGAAVGGIAIAATRHKRKKDGSKETENESDQTETKQNKSDDSDTTDKKTVDKLRLEIKNAEEANKKAVEETNQVIEDINKISEKKVEKLALPQNDLFVYEDGLITSTFKTSYLSDVVFYAYMCISALRELLDDVRICKQDGGRIADMGAESFKNSLNFSKNGDYDNFIKNVVGKDYALSYSINDWDSNIAHIDKFLEKIFKEQDVYESLLKKTSPEDLENFEKHTNWTTMKSDIQLMQQIFNKCVRCIKTIQNAYNLCITAYNDLVKSLTDIESHDVHETIDASKIKEYDVEKESPQSAPKQKSDSDDTEDEGSKET